MWRVARWNEGAFAVIIFLRIGAEYTPAEEIDRVGKNLDFLVSGESPPWDTRATRHCRAFARARARVCVRARGKFTRGESRTQGLQG